MAVAGGDGKGRGKGRDGEAKGKRGPGEKERRMWFEDGGGFRCVSSLLTFYLRNAVDGMAKLKP